MQAIIFPRNDHCLPLDDMFRKHSKTWKRGMVPVVTTNCALKFPSLLVMVDKHDLNTLLHDTWISSWEDELCTVQLWMNNCNFCVCTSTAEPLQTSVTMIVRDSRYSGPLGICSSFTANKLKFTIISYTSNPRAHS